MAKKKHTNAIMLLADTHLDAPLAANMEYKKLYNVIYENVERRLEACRMEEDDDGVMQFYEPDDLKWYLVELRKCIQPIMKLTGERENKIMESKVDIMKFMASQASMTKEQKEKIRRDTINVEFENCDD